MNPLRVYSDTENAPLCGAFLCAAKITWLPVLTERNGAQISAPLCSPRQTLRSAAGAASAPSEEGAGAPKGFRGATEGEITRGRCLHQSVDAQRVKKRSFAFALVYIKCFRTYSVYLSFRHGVLILYTPCHLPPQREARALPRRAQKFSLRAHGAQRRAQSFINKNPVLILSTGFCS